MKPHVMSPFLHHLVLSSGLLFVGLPLRLYLADSPHLYELLRRMRQLSCGLAEPSVAWWARSGN